MAKDVMVVLRADAQPLNRELKKAEGSVQGLDAALKKGMASMNALIASVATAQAAIAGAQKYIQSSQSTTDEWGRTMAAASRSVDHFFESLSQGTFDSFLSGLDGIITKAKAAYDAVDALGTLQIFKSGRIADIRAEIETLKTNIVKGIDVEVSKTRIRELEKEMLQITTEEASYARAAGRAKLEELIGIGGAVADEIEKLLRSGNPNAQNIALDMAQSIRSESGTLTLNNNILDVAETTAKPRWSQKMSEKNALRYAAWQKFGEAHDDDLKEINSYYDIAANSTAQVQQQIRANQKVLNRKSPAGSSPAPKMPKDYDPATGMILPNAPVPQFSDMPTKVTSSMSELKRRLAEAQKELDESVNADQAASVDEKIKHIQDLIDVQPLALRVGLNEEDMLRIQQTMEKASESLASTIKPIEITVGSDKIFKSLATVDKQAKDISASIAATTGAFGNLGAAMQNLEDPSAQVAGLVMQALANVAATFAKSLAGTATPWEWIAAAIAGTATMTSTIVAIKSATSGSYADGGIIPGNSRLGDAIPIMANAGEIILNAAQQQNLVSQLEPRDDGSGRMVRSVISGEQIITVVNAVGRRKHKGEIFI